MSALVDPPARTPLDLTEPFTMETAILFSVTAPHLVRISRALDARHPLAADVATAADLLARLGSHGRIDP